MRHPRALIVTYTIATAALLGGCHKSPPPAEVKDPAKPVESVAGHARPADAWSSLISEATAGKLQAQLLAAYAYSQGETVPRNLDEALRWYRTIRLATHPDSDDRNQLRHTAITYHCLAFKNPLQTAYIAGNSVSIIQNHYLNMNVPEADALKLYELTPTKAVELGIL